MTMPFHGTVDTDTHRSRGQMDIPWFRDQVYYTTPIFPNHPGFMRIPRRRSVKVSGLAVNGTSTQAFRTDFPSTAYLLTGTARDAGGAALPVNLHPLETFRVQFDWGTGDKIDSESVLARNVLGTAEHPAHVGGGGYPLDTAQSVTVTITALRANMEFDVTLWLIEERQGNNYRMAPVAR